MNGGRFRAPLLTAMFFVCLIYGRVVCAQGSAFYEQAEKHRNNKEYSEAISLYAKAIQQESENYNYYYKKGLCELIIRNYEDAIISFRSAVRVNPEFSEGYVYLSKIYINRKDYSRAVYYLGKSYDTEKDAEKQLGYKLAIIKFLILLDKRQEALTEIEATRTLAPDNHKLSFIEGQIHGKLGAWDQALTSYQQALSTAQSLKAPTSVIAKYKYSVGLAHFKLGNQEEFLAIQKELETAQQTHYANKLKNSKLVSNYQGAGFYMRLAKSYLRANAYDEALHWAQKAVNKSLESTGAAHKMVGYIHFKAGRYAAAVESYQAAVGFESDPAALTDVYQTLLKLEFTNQNYVSVAAVAEKLHTLNPTYADAYYYEAAAVHQLGLYGLANALAIRGAELAARTKIKNKDEIAPANMRGLCFYQQAQSLKKLGRLSEAKSALKKARMNEALRPAIDEERKFIGKSDSLKRASFVAALKKSRGKSETDLAFKARASYALNEVANAYLTGNHFDEAAAWTQASVVLDDSSALAYRMEGKIHYQAGNFIAANRAFQKSLALEKDPAKREKLYETTIKLCYNTGDDLGVLRLANQYLENNKPNPDVLYLKALGEYNLKLYTAAARSIENALKLVSEKDLNGNKAYFYFTIGLACKKAGQSDKARETFKKVKYAPLKVATTYEIQSLTTK